MRLRLAVWNCNMRLHDKLEGLCLLRPDVIVVPECACPEALLRRVPDLGASSLAWTGRSARKGLAVFAFGEWHVTTDRAHDPRGGTSLPVRVTGPAELRLVALWANPRGPERLLPAIERLSTFLAEGPAAIAGDFNSTLARTTAAGVTIPSLLAQRIETMGFGSAYHRAGGATPGDEPEPTLWLRRREGLRRHRDVIFLDAHFFRGLRSVEVGARSRWIGASDHAPVLAQIDTGLW